MRGTAVNRSAYRQLENGWAKTLRAGKSVDVEVSLIYDDTHRQISIFVIHLIDGRQYFDETDNTPSPPQYGGLDS
jgi:hypothetical protein